MSPSSESLATSLSDEKDRVERRENFSLSAASAQIALDDALLVERFKRGDEDAFAEIAARYRPKLFDAAFEFIRNRSDAEEIAQDALIRAHRALVDFRGDSSLATWLNRVVSNLARNHYWHQKRRGTDRTMSMDSEIVPGHGESFASLFADRSATVAQDLSLREFSALIDLCMERLEPTLKEILTLRNIDRLSYREIGTKLNVPSGTVKTRIARARRFLIHNLSEICPDFGEAAPLFVWFEPGRGRSA